MSQPPDITDRKILRLHRARADLGRASFLHQTVADLFKERLAEINKPFRRQGLLTAFPDFWRDQFAGQSVSEESLSQLAGQSLDLLLNPLTLHWSNDPVRDLVLCRHTLAPDGLFLGCLLGGDTLTELRKCLATAEAELAGGLTPRILPMAHIADAGALLQRAGFALPVSDAFSLDVSYPHMFGLMADLRAMGETSALTAGAKRFTSRSLFARAAEVYTETFGRADGRITATFDLIFLTGWAPSETQQQPLRPGSATVRLADHLQKQSTED